MIFLFTGINTIKYHCFFYDKRNRKKENYSRSKFIRDELNATELLHMTISPLTMHQKKKRKLYLITRWLLSLSLATPRHIIILG